jgi:hypothetical protein
MHNGLYLYKYSYPDTLKKNTSPLIDAVASIVKSGVYLTLTIAESCALKDFNTSKEV